MPGRHRLAQEVLCRSGGDLPAAFPAARPPDVHFGLPVSLFFPVLKEVRMPAWKVPFILMFACVCLALVLATLVVPLALGAADHRWLWFGGLLLASICMGTLFTLFLKREDRNFKLGR
jgi:hypothetical protein